VRSGRLCDMMTELGKQMRGGMTGRVLLTACMLVLGGWGGTSQVRAQGLYHIDQRVGAIEFTVRHLGLWSSHGMFDRFIGELIIDPAHPTETQIKVDVDARSISMPWDQAVAMLRSADFFDVGEYPSIKFTSTAVQQVAPDRFRIQGKLRIRGITHNQTLDAHLLDLRSDAAHGTQLADFVVSGNLRRTDYGMVADEGFISDQVEIRIHARIVLDHSGPE
jgi:polyisoprenoid-binding protein YceI